MKDVEARCRIQKLEDLYLESNLILLRETVDALMEYLDVEVEDRPAKRVVVKKQNIQIDKLQKEGEHGEN